MADFAGIAAVDEQMDAPTKPSKPDLSDVLAAERTLLAWIRTGLAAMGFGFVVARFGLFLQEIQITQHGAAAKRFGFSLWFGTALILVGVMLNVLSARRYGRLIQQLTAGQLGEYRPARQGIMFAVFLALVGLAMAIYLIVVRTPGQ